MKYTLVKPRKTPSGHWDDGMYEVSLKEQVDIPDHVLKDAIIEDFEAKGIKQMCKIITIYNNRWIVLDK
jgi:hypothetical protein